MKKSIFKKEQSATIDREQLKALYTNNIYNIFLTSHKWNGLNYQQVNFIMRKLWASGSVALYPLKHFESEPKVSDRFILTTFTPQNYNIYDYPTEITLINTRGVKFIPNKSLKVDKDVIITYVQPSKKSLASFVDVYINKIVNVEMILQIALNSQKLPFLIRVSEENRQEIEQLYRSLQSDAPKLFVSGDYDRDISALITGAPYIIDKLYNYKSCLWNELLTYLGVNNLGINEKKEHLVTSEVEANDQYIAISRSCITDLLKDFCTRVNELFNYNISVTSIAELQEKETPQEDEQEDDQEEDPNND